MIALGAILRAISAPSQYGYSRDHCQNRRQIELALLVNRDGIPIAHQVFEGSTKDSPTGAEPRPFAVGSSVCAILSILSIRTF